MNSSQKVLPYKGFMLVTEEGYFTETMLDVPETVQEERLMCGRVVHDSSVLNLPAGTTIVYKELSGQRLDDSTRLLRWEEAMLVMEG